MHEIKFLGTNDKGYLDVSKVFRQKKGISIICAGRSTGKTYGIEEYLKDKNGIIINTLYGIAFSSVLKCDYIVIDDYVDKMKRQVGLLYSECRDKKIIVLCVNLENAIDLIKYFEDVKVILYLL